MHQLHTPRKPDLFVYERRKWGLLFTQMTPLHWAAVSGSLMSLMLIYEAYPEAIQSIDDTGSLFLFMTLLFRFS